MRKAPSWRALAARLSFAVIVFVAAFALVRWWDFTLPRLGGQTYQAVFLSNGQTYFGRYYDRLGRYAKIEDAFYLQQQPAVERGQPPQTQLVRRGGELHGPEPHLLVSKTSVLFVEDLKPSSQIVRAMTGQP